MTLRPYALSPITNILYREEINMARSRSKKDRPWWIRLALIGVVALTLGFLVDFGSLVLRVLELDAQAAAYREEIAQLMARRQELARILEQIRSEEFLLLAARERLLLGEPGVTYPMLVEPAP